MIQQDSNQAQRGVTAGCKGQRKRQQRHYGADHPQSDTFGNRCLGIASFFIMAAMIVATYMAFPDYVDRQLDHGRQVVASSLGLVP